MDVMNETQTETLARMLRTTGAVLPASFPYTNEDVQRWAIQYEAAALITGSRARRLADRAILIFK